jgi:hypothetical protein
MSVPPLNRAYIADAAGAASRRSEISAITCGYTLRTKMTIEALDLGSLGEEIH